MKVKIVLPVTFLFLLILCYGYFFSIWVVIDTTKMANDVEQLVCTDGHDKEWNFDSVQAQTKKHRLITVDLGQPVLCTIKIKGYIDKEFVADGYIYYSDRLLEINIKEEPNETVSVVSSTLSWGNTSKLSSTYNVKKSKGSE